jgi:uncharacterized phage protein gp47/JayE
MAGYPIRTLADIVSQARGFFVDTIPGAIASVWANTFTVIGKVIGLVDFENEQRREWIYRQQSASTADVAALQRMGWELGLGGLEPATPATGTAAAACTAGLLIPAGLQYERADGATFSVRMAVTPAGSTVSLSLQADSAGAGGNTDAGDTLTLVPSNAAPSGLGASATVDAQEDGGGLEGGTDAETVEHYRQRVLLRKRQPPTGGSAPDYQRWVIEAVPTAIAVFVDYFTNNTRAVWVTFLVSDQPNGIPTDGQVAAAQAYVDDPIRRPVTARVSVVKPVAQTLNFTYANLSPDTADAEAAVKAELAAIFAENVRPATPNEAFVFYREWGDAALDRAPGVIAGTLTSPAGDTTYSTAPQMPVLGTITFV